MADPILTIYWTIQNRKRSRFYGDCCCVWDTSVRTLDIPFGDYFTIEDRWIIKKADGSTDEAPEVNVQVGRIIYIYRTWCQFWFWDLGFGIWDWGLGIGDWGLGIGDLGLGIGDL